MSFYITVLDDCFYNFQDLTTHEKKYLHLEFPVKDTDRETAPSNKTPALTKSTNMGVCVVGTTNQLVILKQNW